MAEWGLMMRQGAGNAQACAQGPFTRRLRSSAFAHPIHDLADSRYAAGWSWRGRDW